MHDRSAPRTDPAAKKSILPREIAVHTDLILSRVIAILTVLTGLGLLAVPFLYERRLGSILIVLALFLTMLAARYLVGQGRIRPASIVTVTSVWIVFATVIFMGGGLNNVNIVFFVSLTAVSGLLLGGIGIVVSAGAGIGAGLIFAVLAAGGWLPPRYFLGAPFVQWTQLTFAIIVTASTLNIALRDRDNALRVAGSELSERLEAEAALRLSEEKYRGILESIEEAYFEIDLDGTFTLINQAKSRILGYAKEEVIGTKCWSYLDEEWGKSLRELHEGIRRTGVPQNGICGEYIRKDGTRGFGETSLSLITDGEGNPVGFRGLTRDATERRRSEEERRKLEERLQQAEKMEALGTLAGGVAHDLNNVLGVVVGYAELLLNRAAPSDPDRPRLEKIMKGGDRAAAIVQDLLTLARRGVPCIDVLNLNRVVADSLQLPEFEKLQSYHPGVRIKTDLDPELLNISGSSVHLEKTLFNLVSNASEAMAKEGVVTIRTSNMYLERPVGGYDDVREGDYVVLSVSDTGEGIPGKDLKRIFEPFYTKKVMGRSGTGLGLAVVWGTVKDHNGYIDVQSVEGKGSVFSLYFPVTRRPVAAEAASVSVSKYMGRGESVLVVDDMPEQRDLAAEMLRSLHYEVACVCGGEEALEHLKKHAADLVVLDMIMDPGMDGLETYSRICEIRPGQKAIIVSGFSESVRVSAAQALGAGTYVRKPYVMEKLGLAVRMELDGELAGPTAPAQTDWTI